MKKQDWSKSHCGVMLCSYEKTLELMPEVQHIIQPLVDSGELEFDIAEYVIDVRVHMLLTDQFPCIPSWHQDFVPRGEDKKKDHSLITGEKMYLWVSGEPQTEFVDKPELLRIGSETWAVLDQTTVHRGVKATKYCWRCFIRLIPRKFIHDFTDNVGTLRRHTQVYLDAKDYEW